MFKLVCLSGPGGDETTLYRVEFKKTCTVEEFINEILKKRPNEWGTISIGKFQLKYSRGELLGDAPSAYLRYSFILDIKKASAHGGWGRMDYSIITE